MFNNLNSTLKKVVVIFLIITLTYANLVLIGNNIVQGLISYAAEGEEEQPTLAANQELVMNKVCEINGEEKRVIQIAIETGIESEDYPIKESKLTLSTEIVEEAYEDVKVTKINKNSYTSGTCEVSEDGKLIISLVNENETLETKAKGLDKLLVTYVFPNTEIEAIKQPLEKAEVKTYADDTLANEYTESNFESIEVEKDLLLLNIENKDIHKTTIEEGQVQYTENLKLDLSYRTETSNIIIEDISNEFYDNNEEISLKYVSTKINKEDLSSVLGENGKLIITDKTTDKVLVELTNEYITSQELDVKTEQKFIIEETSEEETRAYVTITNETIEIEYVEDVTKFKLEMQNIKAQSESEIELSEFVVTNTKSISNINNLEELNYLQENVKYIIDDIEKTAESKITFKDTITRASLTVDNTEWVVGQANTVNYLITLDTTSEKSELFVNPMLLIELPASVESVNAANSKFAIKNNNGAFTNRRVFITSVLGRKFVVITLEGAQTEETIVNGDAVIDLTLELNVTENTTEGNETTKLYYQNNTVTAYESGASFDTAEIDITLIMESEPKEDLIEDTEFYNVGLWLRSSVENVVKPNEEFIYTARAYNYSVEEKQELTLTNVLPEGITIKEVIEVTDEGETEADYNYNEETRTLTINIDKIVGVTEGEFVDEETGETVPYTQSGVRTFKITVKANELEEGVYSKEIKNIIKLENGNKVLAEAEEVNTIADKLLIVETENLAQSVNEEEQIILGLKITNKGLETASGVTVQVALPEEIAPSMFKVSRLSETGEEETSREGALISTFEDSLIEIPVGKTYYLQLKGTVEDIEETKQITITGNVNGNGISWTTEIVNIPTEEEQPEQPTEPETPIEPEIPKVPTETIDPGTSSGPVKDETEEPETPTEPETPNIPTGTINPGTSSEPTPPEPEETPEEPGETPEEPGETPEEPGETPEEPGETPEEPGKTPEEPDETPEEPGETPEEPGETPEEPGKTPEEPDETPEEPGEIPEESTDKFDLSLTQTLSKITVTNSNGTTTYDYKDTNFAKVEIHSKLMNGSKVTLEYKIIVKNEGTIPGYARKIVDYLPKGLTFNPDLNLDWFVGDDGNIYSTKLINTILNPGETAELTIILEKSMTNDNTGTVTNLVEIYEASNSENVEDINSIPGDKLEGQNDMSKVEVIIATSTGTIILYTTLAIAVIAILGIGFYRIKKITLNKKGGC